MRLFELSLDSTIDVNESSGYIPKNEKEALDPRWQMAMTCDVKPGEPQKQAKKLGFKVDKTGRPPMLKSNGKIDASFFGSGVK